MTTTTTCSKCGQYLAPGTGMIAIGVLCPRCYADDPYGEEAARPKPARPVRYTTRKVWGAASAARMRAVMGTPVLTATGDPMPKGAVVTERDGDCWQCHEPVLAGQAEAIWNGARHLQQAACPSCTWRSAYALVWPELSREEALGMALLCLSMGTLHLAKRAGYNAAEILSGILTPEVIAGLPVAIALSAGARS
jgi:hypothetical protein